MSKIKSALKGVFGGGASYLHLVWLFIALGFITERAIHIKAIKTLKIERNNYKSASEGKDATIRTQAQTQARKAKQEEQSNDAETHVNNADDPVDGAIEWLRNNPDPSTPLSDKANVPVRQ